ncbi:phosphopantetheine-binding protein [Streptomyces cellulosae]|uniref:Phosphopantetheine-binding protein n=2 Tax=Streptomyces TaxID=1883 RepID=A0ABU3JC58_9ACTN|nr:acyl carrier protein [Streptomyces sp. McG7]MBT2908181.1 acyl carrier protein [Streptomyces sp. McG8]MCX4475768.1 phosphopantetheine-binding protein [Streptomyces cellulosae]MDQ0489472.1 act minimal PKS acyl carrier protein [Streptomyces thermodiastaticus]MDT6972624.1 phosphopantetheine-binding protein [Streptomyces thermocarboxydus]MDX3417640.1 phosphopantetheine-binding protein [Streptomyces sp. MD20-1-1]MXQ59589.1 acyl carrier protein [Streptomyces sp. XHT-2]MYQ31285.1 acyl carrier pro
MASFTLSEFKAVVDACFDGAEAAALEESVLDSEFADLGYDSLTVYEIVVRIQDEFSVRVPDEQLDELTTPGALIAYVDAQLAAA